MSSQRRTALVVLSGALLAIGAGLVWYGSSLNDGDAQTARSGLAGSAAVENAELARSMRSALPAGTRPALLAFVDPEAATRLPVDFPYQVERVSDPAEVNAVVAVLRDTAEGDTIRHEAANLLRRSAYPELEQVLIECLRHPNEQERFRSWAVQHLFMVFEERKAGDPSTAASLLVPLLEDPQPAVRREALLSLHRLHSAAPANPETRTVAGDVVATAARWLADPATVDLALRVLREREAKAYVPQVRAILADESAAPPARIAAMVTLSEWNDAASREAIAQIAQLPDQPTNFRLRRSAQMALERFASNDPPDSDSERAEPLNQSR